MKKRALCIIQARMGSTRLPGKVLIKVGGISLLERVVSRAKSAKRIDKVVVATTANKNDEKIEKFCKKIGVDCFRGSEEDVLDRFYQCVKLYPGHSAIVRITADCPLLDPQIIDKVIKIFFSRKVSYASNVIPPMFPDGMDVEVFSFQSLEEMWKKAKKQHEREHVTAHIRDNPQKFRIANLNNKEDLSGVRLTVDYKEDIRLIEELLKLLPVKFGFKDIIRVLKKEAALLGINKKYKRHDGYSGWKKHCYNFKKQKHK